MKSIEIFDPAMCCSTGVCGPSIDPNLMRVASLLDAVAKNDVEVTRHNLGSEPQDFLENKTVSELLQNEGVEVLPVTFINGELVKTKEYPSTEEFSEWLELNFDTQPAQTSSTSCCDGATGSGTGCC